MLFMLPNANGQSFSNLFLWVDDARVNLVQLRELRNDPSLYSKLSEKIPLSAVRNRDRQVIDSILQISDAAVTDALKHACSGCYAYSCAREIHKESQMITKEEHLRALLVLQWVHLAMYSSVMLELGKF